MISTQPNCTDSREPGLLSVDQALIRILAATRGIVGYQQLDLSEACGRTLQETIHAPFNVPGHDNAAMDGYAILSSDVPRHGCRELSIAGHVYAGQVFQGQLQPGQCIRITTGAPLPAGADCVVMQEQTSVADGKIRIDNRHRRGQNIRLAGEDIGQGTTVLKAGRWLTPADIGLLASLGIAEIKVKRKLRIAVASTGDEIHPLGEPRAAGGVYDSNRYSLLSALTRPDIELIDLGILADDPGSLQKRFDAAARCVDMIVCSGGVSVGDADYTKSALGSSGRLDFWKIAIKPGRPLAFGQLHDSIFFGLPGNPVAVLVSFYTFVLPAVERMLGIVDKPLAPTLTVACSENLRKKEGRTEIVRGIIERNPCGEWTVRSTGPQSSGILRSMSLANAFIVLEHDRGDVAAGELVSVRPFAGLIG